MSDHATRDDLDDPVTVATALILRYKPRPLSDTELRDARDGHILRTLRSEHGLIVEAVGRVAM